MSLVLAGLVLPCAATAGPWVMPPGTLWVKAGFLHWSGDEEFAGNFDRNLSLTPPREVGDRKPFDDSTGGEFTTSIAYLYAVYGVVEGLQVSAYVPHQWLSFEDTSFRGESQGIGDPIIGVRYAPVQWVDGWSFALAGEIKIPTGELPAEFTVIPLSEGQFDWTTGLSVGYSAIPRLMVSVDLGYQVRFPFVDDDAGRDVKPGNAFIFAGEVQGEPVLGWFLKTTLRGSLTDGREERSGSGIVALEGRRRIVEAWFSTYVQLFRLMGLDPSGDGLGIDASYVVPLAGEDYPAGYRFDVGLAWQQSF